MVINNSLRINTKFIKKTIENTLNQNINNNLYFLDNSGNNIINNKQKNVIKNNIIKDFLGVMDYNLYLSIDKNYCIYKFQKGKKYGKYCNRKIHIKTDNDVEFYCSRHNKNYDANQRTYEKRKQCDYIRDNGLRCKNHRIYNNFCYVHKHHNIKIDPFLKLNKLRDLYYKNIKKKRKKQIDNYSKQNKKLKSNAHFYTFKKNNNNKYFHINQGINNFDNAESLYVKNLNYGLCKCFMFKTRKKYIYNHLLDNF